VTFDIQAYGGDDAEIEANWTDLLDHGLVRLRREALVETEYESFICDADLILLPYLRGPYQSQTSGVYCEAAALGIPVVVPSGTWMADQVTKNGGGVLFDAGDEASLANACLEAITNYHRLREMAAEAAPAWRSFHNARNFVASLECSFEGLPRARAA